MRTGLGMADGQLYKDGEPQVYCADCLFYGDGRAFPGDSEMDIVQCPDCGGERTFALTQAKKDEIDAGRECLEGNPEKQGMVPWLFMPS